MSLDKLGTSRVDRLPAPVSARSMSQLRRREAQHLATPIPITALNPAECACSIRRNPASVSSIAPSSWMTKSRSGSRRRRPAESCAARGSADRDETTDCVRCAFQLRNLRLGDLVGTGKVRRWKVHEGPFRLLPWLSRIRIPLPRYIRRDLSPSLALIWHFPCSRPLPIVPVPPD